MVTPYLVFDTETEAFAPGAVAPPAFVAIGLTHKEDGDLDQTIYVAQDYEYAASVVRARASEGYVIVGHNLAFDLGVLGLVPERGWKLLDTMIADLLERLARDDCAEDAGGSPVPRSLEALFGAPLAGKGTTQLSFRAGHPLSREQQDYLRADVAATETVYLCQRNRGLGWAQDEMLLQVRARMALDRLTQTGIPVDDAAIATQEVEYAALRREAAAVLQASGVWEGASVGPRGGRRKEKVLQRPFLEHVGRLLTEAGEDIETTDTGRVRADKHVLTQLTHDPVVKNWLVYKGCEKLLSTYLRVWKGAGTVHARYRLMMRSGRTSSHSPNLQQVPSRGEKAQLKKVFVPPAGRVFYELDFCQLELCTLAAYTRGELFRRINAGEDIHRYLGSVYFQKPPDQVTKDERQLMKCANFGLPGGMGPRKFRIHIRQNGLPDPGQDAATALRNAWLAAFPEMTQWLEDPDGDKYGRTVRQLWSGREGLPLSDDAIDEAWRAAEQLVYTAGERIPVPVRRRLLSWITKGVGAPLLETWLVGRKVTVPGGRTRHPVSYTEQRNTRFQGLAANLTKDALASVVLEDNPAWSVHAFIHDSVLITTYNDPGYGDAAADMVAQRMLGAARRWLPDVRCGVEVSGPGKNWYEAKKAKVWSVFTDAKSAGAGV